MAYLLLAMASFGGVVLSAREHSYEGMFVFGCLSMLFTWLAGTRGRASFAWHRHTHDHAHTHDHRHDHYVHNGGPGMVSPNWGQPAPALPPYPAQLPQPESRFVEIEVPVYVREKLVYIPAPAEMPKQFRGSLPAITLDQQPLALPRPAQAPQQQSAQKLIPLQSAPDTRRLIPVRPTKTRG